MGLIGFHSLRGICIACFLLRYQDGVLGHGTCKSKHDFIYTHTKNALAKRHCYLYFILSHPLPPLRLERVFPAFYSQHPSMGSLEWSGATN